eukprot:2976542-Amphidinium_carterae.1
MHFCLYFTDYCNVVWRPSVSNKYLERESLIEQDCVTQFHGTSLMELSACALCVGFSHSAATKWQNYQPKLRKGRKQANCVQRPFRQYRE